MKKYLLIILAGLSFQTTNAALTPSPDLKKIAFSKDYEMPTRWKAFMDYVQKENKNSIPEIKLALKSNDWFMRDAALKALLLVDPQMARNNAQQILKNDKSLIVRTGAVDIIRSLKDKDSAKLLWQALRDKKNFRNQQSLWIRPRIITTLVEMDDKSLGEYVKTLDDSDVRIQKIALFALEKFTKEALATDKESLDIHIARWKEWWKKKANSKS